MFNRTRVRLHDVTIKKELIEGSPFIGIINSSKNIGKQLNIGGDIIECKIK
jgi:hypothetical protein